LVFGPADQFIIMPSKNITLFSRNESIRTRVAQFFTATIQNWKPLLKQDTYKNIIINTLRVLVSEGKLTVNGFVIMSNHVHIIWQSKGRNDMQKIQTSFMKHTSKEFRKQLEKDNNIKDYEVNTIDRKYNFWQRDSLNIELFTAAVLN
jgi:putative transposase